MRLLLLFVVFALCNSFNLEEEEEEILTTTPIASTPDANLTLINNITQEVNITSTSAIPIVRVEEEDRPLARCPSSAFIRCKDGMMCIHKKWMCDGKVDCADTSDEEPHICLKRSRTGSTGSRGEFYSSQVKCPQNWYYCKDGSVCLDPYKVCDKIKDCKDGSDEGVFCAELAGTMLKKHYNGTVIYKK